MPIWGTNDFVLDKLAEYWLIFLLLGMLLFVVFPLFYMRRTCFDIFDANIKTKRPELVLMCFFGTFRLILVCFFCLKLVALCHSEL